MIFLLRRRRKPVGLPRVPQGLDFIAFDVETANETRLSICAIGFAIVQHGAVTAVGSTLVNPECDFNPYNSAINGIQSHDVESAPTLPQLWPELHALLDGQRLAAHSASFDVGALRAGAARYSLVGPTVELYCSHKIAKQVWPAMPSHGLGYVAPALGVNFDHHEAGADAYACAEIMLHACQQTGTPSIMELAVRIGFEPGRLTPDSYQPSTLEHERSRHAQSLTSRDGDPNADPAHPLYGRTICFTGGMFAMSRSEAADEVVQVGGTFRTSVSKKLDYLVIGDADYVAFADGWKTGKLKKAVELRGEGAAIEIIAERDFLALLRS